MDVSLSGSGDIVLNIESNKAKANVSGSGDITLKGRASNLLATVTGSGDFHGFDLDSVNTEVSVTGSGDAKVNCSGELKARVTGSGDIEYRGNPTREDTKVVDREAFKTNTLIVKTIRSCLSQGLFLCLLWNSEEQ